VTDPEGEQVADLYAVDAADHDEHLSNGRTFDHGSSLRVTEGSVLYSNRSRPMLEVVRDDVGVHDFLLTPCSPQTFALLYEDAAPDHPSCLGNLADALGPFGIAEDAIGTTLNVFMDVRVAEDGTLSILPPPSRPGDAFAVRALRDLLVGLTACSAEKSNNGTCTSIDYAVS
jgi:uncharacterized protein YcgI (DUF1989 family)